VKVEAEPDEAALAGRHELALPLDIAHE